MTGLAKVTQSNANDLSFLRFVRAHFSNTGTNRDEMLLVNPMPSIYAEAAFHTTEI